MEKQNRDIEYSNYWFNKEIWLIILYLFFAIIVMLILTLLMGNKFIGFSIIIGILFPIFVICFLCFRGNHTVNSIKNQKFPENLNTEFIEHDAFIIIHSMGIYSFDLQIGIENLILSFVRKKYPFKIYHCYNPEEFIEVLKNDKAKYIWIFGHGWRGGITFKWANTLKKVFSKNNNNTRFDYAKIQTISKEIPKKLFIAQLHCNHHLTSGEENLSLIEVILNLQDDSVDYYLTKGLQHDITIWFATYHLGSTARRNNCESETDKSMRI